MNNNFNIAATKITDLIRVSSAAIWYDHENRFQIETIVFSDDPNQKFRMFIHGNHFGEIDQNDPLLEYARTFHRRIALKLNKRFNGKS
jgi:hypothetical protein